MKKRNLIFVVVTLFLLSNLFVQCKKEEDDDNDYQTEVSEDKEDIANSFDGVFDCIVNLKDGDAITAITNFINMQNGEVINEDWIEAIVEELDTYIDYDYIEDNRRFNFLSHVGTYTWNAVTETWSKSNSPTNKIILEFPSERNNNENNVILTFNSYNDQYVTFEDEQFWLPTSLQIDLKIDNIEIINLNAKNISYNNSNFSIPIDVNIDLTVKPYNFTITANKETDTKFHFELQCANNGVNNFTLSTDISIVNSDYENLFDDDVAEYIKSITGEISYDKLSFPFKCDAEKLFALNDELTATQINTFIDVEVFYNDFKIGDLEYQNNNDAFEVFIIYKDGSSENTDVYYMDFIEDLEALLINYTGAWNLTKKENV